jgi:starvation-inducible DNA-binding protein
MYNHSHGTSGKQELAMKLSVILADVVAYRALAHGFHWNVKGPEFIQFHDFFATLYEDADSSIDPLAENVRKLGYDAPVTLEDFVSLSCVQSRTSTGDPIEMSSILYEVNQHIRGCLVDGFRLADECDQQGIADFLAGRIDMHDKWIWQLGTTVGADATTIQTLIQ